MSWLHWRIPALALAACCACTLTLDFTAQIHCDGSTGCPEELRCIAGSCAESGPVCGDFVVDPGEQCDDGDAITNACSDYGARCDVCGATCVIVDGADGPRCGDGVIQAAYEACDDGAENSDVAPDACRTTCELPRCGDQVVDSAETCDDGNDATESCDYGLTSCTTCTAFCNDGPGVASYCGDGSPDETHGEACDLGAANGVCGSTCMDACEAERIVGLASIVDSRPLVAADLDRDGVMDLAVANAATNNRTVVLLGVGDGTFRSPVGSYAGVVQASSITSGDFDGDGDTDIALADSASIEGASLIAIHLGNGDGTVQPATTYSVGANPNSITSADFDGDGVPDLVFGLPSDRQVSLMRGIGDGSFQAPVNHSVGWLPLSIAASDFNGDGVTDLAVANHLDNNVSVLQSNGDGTFQVARTYTVGSGPHSVTSADFNGDGNPDLAVSNRDSSGLSLLLGVGDCTFQTATDYPVGTDPFRLVSLDINGDSRVDTAFSSSNGVWVFYGRGDGTLHTLVQVATSASAIAFVTTRADSDGYADIIAANGVGTDMVRVVRGCQCRL